MIKILHDSGQGDIYLCKKYRKHFQNQLFPAKILIQENALVAVYS